MNEAGSRVLVLELEPSGACCAESFESEEEQPLQLVASSRHEQLVDGRFEPWGNGRELNCFEDGPGRLQRAEWPGTAARV